MVAFPPIGVTLVEDVLDALLAGGATTSVVLVMVMVMVSVDHVPIRIPRAR